MKICFRSINGFYNKMIFMLVFILTLFSYFPPMQALSFYNQVKLILALTVVLAFFLARPVFYIQSGTTVILIIIFIFYTLLISYFYNNNTVGNRYLDISQIYIFYMIYLYYKDDPLVLRLILKWNTPFIIITSLLTTTMLFNSPYLVRKIKSAGEYSLQMKLRGIGGYEFIYFLVPVSLILFHFLIGKKQKRKEWFTALICFLLFTTNIVISNYFTALVLLGLGVLVLVFFRVKHRLLRMSLLFLLPLIIMGLDKIVLYFANITISVLRWFGISGKTVDRLKMFAIEGNTDVWKSIGIYDRLHTFETSIEGFLRNPFFGSINKNLIVNETITGLGQHSYFIDTFNLFGLFIGIVCLIISIGPVLRKRMDNNQILGIKITMLIFVVGISVMNNVTPSIGLGSYLIYNIYIDRLLRIEQNDHVTQLN